MEENVECDCCGNEMEYQPEEPAAGIPNAAWVCDCGHSERVVRSN